jgi:hypothetical protein
MKRRADSSLAKLSEEQLDQLYDWLSEHSYREVIAMAGKGPPEGFGVRLHKTTLVRFYGAERARRHAEALAEAKSDRAPGGNPAELMEQTTLQLAHASYEMSLGPLSGMSFNNVSRALHRHELTALRRIQVEINQKQLGLQEERVALEKKRLELEVREFEHSAVEAAARHATKLNEIGSDPKLNDRQKYSLAREVLFGNGEMGTLPTGGSGEASHGDTER